MAFLLTNALCTAHNAFTFTFKKREPKSPSRLGPRPFSLARPNSGSGFGLDSIRILDLVRLKAITFCKFFILLSSLFSLDSRSLNYGFLDCVLWLLSSVRCGLCGLIRILDEMQQCGLCFDYNLTSYVLLFK